MLITQNWAANVNYTVARQHVSLPAARGSAYHYFDPATVVNILSLGVIYHF